jgi:hypothetical protein
MMDVAAWARGRRLGGIGRWAGWWGVGVCGERVGMHRAHFTAIAGAKGTRTARTLRGGLSHLILHHHARARACLAAGTSAACGALPWRVACCAATWPPLCSRPSPHLMAPPRRRRITFEWASAEFNVGEYAVPGPLGRVLQQAVCIVMDGGGASSGAALAAAVPPGAPGAAFLADLVDEAAREKEWASGEEARGVFAELLGWIVANAEEVMVQAAMSGGAGAGMAAAVSAAGKAAGDDGGRAGSCGVLLTRCGHSDVVLQWRGRNYKSRGRVVLDAATAAACADVARITLRGWEAAVVDGKFHGLNFPPDGPTSNAYITALLAAAPADDARWLVAAGSAACGCIRGCAQCHRGVPGAHRARRRCSRGGAQQGGAGAGRVRGRSRCQGGGRGWGEESSARERTSRRVAFAADPRTARTLCSDLWHFILHHLARARARLAAGALAACGAVFRVVCCAHSSDSLATRSVPPATPHHLRCTALFRYHARRLFAVSRPRRR